MDLNNRKFHKISGIHDGKRIDSRVLEEEIQRAVANGHRFLEVHAYGQHGLGGRLWKAGEEKVYVRITGHPGQRVGSMGFPNTTIEVMGPASDDVGWLNAGAEIVVHGNATNGVANAMAQGKIYVAGNIGARGMTMTKHNPRFEPPELWVLGCVGDFFAEFMAGGIAVICGHDPQDPENILGYRPCVGMVGGQIYFRGPHKGFSQVDASLVPIGDEEWEWLVKNLHIFLEKINKTGLFDRLSNREEWQLLRAKSPFEKRPLPKKTMEQFRDQIWDRELGKGGIIGDLTPFTREPIPLIATGELRRFVPVWENKKYIPPCEASCPAGLPVQELWKLIREGRAEEAADVALAYTPFPGTVCGYLCPHVCMVGCTRTQVGMQPVDITHMGKKAGETRGPDFPTITGGKVAIIGGGPAGISAAWQLRRKGHEVVVYDLNEELGGKVTSAVPKTRVPDKLFENELRRAKKALSTIHLRQGLTGKDIERLKADFDFIVLAVGAQRPRTLPVPGKEKAITALEFLSKSKKDKLKVGKRVVIIGAGNVGCDVATEAHRLGAEDVVLIDIQEPASFGKERQEAEAIGARFQWPCFTKAITDKGVELATGKVIPADTVVVAIGDELDPGIVPPTVATEKGFVVVNELYQTTDSQIFAVGDAVRLGLLTDAIGSGRKAAEAISQMLTGRRPKENTREMIDYTRVRLEYFDPRKSEYASAEDCATNCASCGACRDCGLCVTICPQGAITRKALDQDDFEMVVDGDKCIGCGFCADACPCGIWTLVENEPMET